MEGPQRFLGIFLFFLFFVFFLRKRKWKKKKVRRLKEKTTLLFWGSGNTGPTDLSCLAPEAALTLPAPHGGPLG